MSRYTLEPADEFPHDPGDEPTYNESMYLNLMDHETGLGAWFRIGNRPNEGYAEVTVCVYLPDGRVAFSFGRPKIEDNSALDAGGLRITVVEPFEQLDIEFNGQLCLLAEPIDLLDPRTALSSNPWVEAAINIEIRGAAPMAGGLPAEEAGGDKLTTNGFAKAHYEQHTSGSGSITIDGEQHNITGFGLRDKSWGPRTWQAVHWYRWLPLSFGDDLAMMLSIIGSPDGEPRIGGMVLEDGAYSSIRSAELTSTWDDHHLPTGLTMSVQTDQHSYGLTGIVKSMVPLRNRRDDRVTRIAEGLTQFTITEGPGTGRVGWGMAEYLDQLIDGVPVGPR